MEKVFREAHSLKGAARAVNLKEIETICQSLGRGLCPGKASRDRAHRRRAGRAARAMDEIERLLMGTRGERLEQGPPKTGDLLGRLEAISRGSTAVEQSGQPDVEVALQRPETEKNIAEETVRVPVDQLDRLLLQVEELVPSQHGSGASLG